MLRQQMEAIFEKVQNTPSSNQKCVVLLSDLYKKTEPQEFLLLFLRFLQVVVRQTFENNIYSKRVLNFASRFCSDITKKEEKESETHEFLTAVVEKILKWSCLDVYDIRYNSCYFISMVLQDIGEEVQLEINLIDEIQRILLERMQETKVPIRLVAMAALVRLQDPLNFECPVVKAYMQALLSGSASVRKDATERIAPNMLTLNKIKDRIRDPDPSVRSVAFHRCADIGPLNFRIADKHLILLCGFKESNEKVKKTFLEYLLPKWLTAYRGDYLKFVGALKLIADDEDINKMTYLSKELIKEFYNKHPIDDLIGVLPINEKQLISVENLTNDVTLFWNILTGLLRDSDSMNEELNRILPELTPLCHYIDDVIKTKSVEKMDEWKFFEYQFDLLNIFEIAENYDYSDEVGRRTMHSLTARILQNNNFTRRLTKKLVVISQKCSSSIEFFTNDMCQLISEIREPLMDEPLSQDQRRERNFKAAELRVTINILKERQLEAVNDRDYQNAQKLADELANHNKQLESLQSESDTEKVRVTKSDNETLCRCLDILGSVLELPAVSKITPSLLTCKDDFLVPLISNLGIEVHWRVLKCLALFALIDKATAEEYAKIICIPVATYRTIPINNVSALIQSICSIPDLIAVHGIEIVSQGEEVTNTSEQNATKRRLYTNDEEDMANTRIDNMTLSYIFEIFLDMLDDEREEIRHKAILAITSLVIQHVAVTPTVLSRILLKWYNPLTEKQDSRLQVRLGMLIDRYVQLKNSCEVMKEAIIPTLTSIALAPRTSPLVDVDIENVLMFFSVMMNINLQKDDIRILALDMCMKISESPNDKVVPFLTKFLCHLDIHFTNMAAMTELIERAEMLLENVLEKIPRRNIEKFVSKLKQQTDKNTSESTNHTEGSVREVTPDPDNAMKEPQQVKRRKSRSVKDCVVVLERLGLNELNDTMLHTIAEASMEMEIDHNLSASDSSKNSKMSPPRTNSVVTTETSDSDFSNDNDAGQRRSNRCRKKRILPNV